MFFFIFYIFVILKPVLKFLYETKNKAAYFSLFTGLCLANA